MLNYVEMKGKNRYIKNAHISERRFKEILRCFCLDLTAKQTSKMTNLNRNTKIDISINSKKRIVKLCQIDSPFQKEIEVDESYFKAKKLKEKEVEEQKEKL